MQSFLEKDNFVNKLAKAKEIVRICIIRIGKKRKNVKQSKVRIEKEMCTQKSLENENYFAFNGMFNFLKGRLKKITHAFSHSYLPFPDFFGHIMHFCKFPWATLVDTYHKFLQTFSFVVAY